MKLSSLLQLVSCVLLGIHTVDAQNVAYRNVSQAKLQSNTPYLITGTVMSSVDQSPVSHCSLTATPADRGNFPTLQFPAEFGAFECDEHGHFSVPLPSSGSWHLTASARGFVAQDYEQHQSFSSAIVLTNTNPKINLEFHISPEAAIAGTVVDDAGEPIRTAEVSLQMLPSPAPDGARLVKALHSSTLTDDRGRYELTGLSPGDYHVIVKAHPWYAVAQTRRQSSTDSDPLDPSLDLTYALTWFPGVDDPSLAETITVHAGDTQQADFHLVPVPAAHIRISSGAGANPALHGRPLGTSLTVQSIASDGASQSSVSLTIQSDANGQVDVGGLAPGKYRVKLDGVNHETQSSEIEVSTGSTRNIDLRASSTDAKVTIQFDGLPTSDLRLAEVKLIDMDTERRSFSSTANGDGPGRFHRDSRRDRNGVHTMDLPSGRYEVVYQGKPDLYLTGITANRAIVEGRYVTLPVGASMITMHMGSGCATLTGIVTMHGTPLIGAMVLLVPTTIEDLSAFRVMREDQTNTDGSFDLSNIIPGQYILIAIDHGWQVNWNDPSTLRDYLGQGIPLDLAADAKIKQNFTLQVP